MTELRPFFSYYGAKWRAAPRYPAPSFGRIVEPFAGSAGYSVRHHAHKVHLLDLDPVIAGVWSYLIAVPAAEVRRLPLTFGHVDEVRAPPEARWLIGFWLNHGAASPRKRPSAWMRSGIRPGSFWGDVVRTRIASQVDSIRHWTVACADYRSAPDLRATWFIDPPYQGAAGRHYRHRDVDYEHLGGWARTRPGTVIVCEQSGAAWLPFRGLGRVKAMEGRGRRAVTDELVDTSEAA